VRSVGPDLRLRARPRYDRVPNPRAVALRYNARGSDEVLAQPQSTTIRGVG
jgi:hypothetical protein